MWTQCVVRLALRCYRGAAKQWRDDVIVANARSSGSRLQMDGWFAGELMNDGGQLDPHT